MKLLFALLTYFLGLPLGRFGFGGGFGYDQAYNTIK